jgi:hypothetical protein
VDPKGGAVRRCLWEGGGDPWKPLLGFHGEDPAFHGQSNKLSIAEQGDPTPLLVLSWAANRGH